MMASEFLTAPTARWPVGSAEVLVFESRGALAAAAAETIARQIQEVAQAKPTVRIVFAAAPSQAEVLLALRKVPDIPWQQVVAFHMDEYLELAPEAPERFANWLDHRLFSKLPFGSVHRIPAIGDPDEICAEYADLICEAPIDIVCLGIGVNGHIAFNDPPVADFEDPQIVKVVELDEICRQQQVDDRCFAKFSDVPTHAVTLTVPALLSATVAICVVLGSHKRNAVKEALEGPIATSCPASILRSHPNCTIFLDAEANPND